MEKNNQTVNVTRTFLPPYEEYEAYLKRIWDSGQLTNNGLLSREFEDAVSKRLGVPEAYFVQNGTLALQLALRALELEPGEIITTPFTYVATTSAIMWEGFTPVYADIDKESLCLDPDTIERCITSRTRAIVPVHVFGNACDVEKIDVIAKKHNLKVLYDAAHAFGVTYRDRSLISYGDVSICSFHATKLFHTIEGGLVFSPDQEVNRRVELMRRFGHTGDEHYMLGINAKASEFQAAMGLANLKHVDELIRERKDICDVYDNLLQGSKVTPVRFRTDTERNYAYYPVLFKSEQALLCALQKLASLNIFPRRYFYPSLNTLPYTPRATCPVSEDVSSRIVCLPLYPGLEKQVIETICKELTS